MQEVADAHGIQVKVEAFSSTAIDFRQSTTSDCIYWDQVRFSFDDVAQSMSKNSVGVIESADYSVNGGRVLKMAISLIKRDFTLKFSLYVLSV